jgi:hypothetical protein
MIAVAVEARRREQRGQPLDQFQGREPQLGATIGLGLGETIDELLVAKLLEPLQGEGWARAVAQQPLQAGAVGAYDPDRSIQREASAVVPAGHLARIGGIERAGAGKPAQHAGAHLLVHCGAVCGCQRAGLGEVDLPVLVSDEHPVDHTTVKVHVGIERGCEALLRKLTAPSHPVSQGQSS